MKYGNFLFDDQEDELINKIKILKNVIDQQSQSLYQNEKMNDSVLRILKIQYFYQFK